MPATSSPTPGREGSTSTARQNLVLDEAGIEDPVVFEEDGGTSSRLHPLQRPKFRALLDYARPGDTVHISGEAVGGERQLDAVDVLDRGRDVPDDRFGCLREYGHAYGGRGLLAFPAQVQTVHEDLVHRGGGGVPVGHHLPVPAVRGQSFAESEVEEVQAVGGGGVPRAGGELPPELGGVLTGGQLQHAPEDHRAVGLEGSVPDERGHLLERALVPDHHAAHRAQGAGGVLLRVTIRSNSGQAHLARPG
ncbi:hypothetical protein ABZ554_20305 [Streptomyces sp. NPDC020125]|uniref:hypothetical protein n=1 Tax=Streptomyces sp. NPDC020125 TaxID=3154593 RepID=UPI00340FA648